MGSSFSSPPPLRELTNVQANCIKMLEFLEMEPIKVSRAVDAERERQDDHLDPFEAQQRKVNIYLREMRDAKMEANDGTTSLGTFGAGPENPTEARAERVARIKKGTESHAKFDKNRKKFKDAMADLEGIFATNENKYKENPSECQEEAAQFSNISFEQKLKIWEKTIELLNEQCEKVCAFGKKDRKAAGSALADKSNHFAMTVNELGELPDLDPKSWENYNKYLAKDSLIDEELHKLYEKNMVLKERAMAMNDHSKRAESIELALAADMEKCTTKSEKASGEMKKIVDAIDGKGPCKICLYIMIILGICGICFLMYCEAADGDCTGQGGGENSNTTRRWGAEMVTAVEAVKAKFISGD